MLRSFGILAGFVWLTALTIHGAAAGSEPAHLRLGLVKFGSAAWEIETVRRQGLDRGLAIDSVELANPGAGEVALLSGSVDAIFTDWIWVAHQRGNGQKISFVPHNGHLGDLLVPAASSIRNLADLDGKRIGVAGGPNDKSWLLLRMYSRIKLGHDLATSNVPVYGAPPLLSQEVESGRVDAVLTFWPYAARLGVKGFRPLLPMQQLLSALDLKPPVPILGFAVAEGWIEKNPGVLPGLVGALGEADRLLASSDAAWTAIRPLMAAEDDAVFLALRERFRLGIVTQWTAADLAQSARLYALLVEIGGADLTSGVSTIPAGTFWTEAAP